MTVGERIREKRIELGLTQDELAQRMGYKGRTSVCVAETKGDNVTTTKVAKFAEALGVSSKYLMGYEEETETANAVSSKTLDLIKDLCNKNGSSLHKLEMDLGYSNGSLSKAKSLPFDRVVAIADYFHVPIDCFIGMEVPDKEERVAEAMKLYDLYVKAIPEISDAVENLLKVPKSDS